MNHTAELPGAVVVKQQSVEWVEPVAIIRNTTLLNTACDRAGPCVGY